MVIAPAVPTVFIAHVRANRRRGRRACERAELRRGMSKGVRVADRVAARAIAAMDVTMGGEPGEAARTEGPDAGEAAEAAEAAPAETPGRSAAKAMRREMHRPSSASASAGVRSDEVCRGGIESEAGAGDDDGGGDGECLQHVVPPVRLEANVNWNAPVDGWRQPIDHANWSGRIRRVVRLVGTRFEAREPRLSASTWPNACRTRQFLFNSCSLAREGTFSFGAKSAARLSL